MRKPYKSGKMTDTQDARRAPDEKRSSGILLKAKKRNLILWRIARYKCKAEGEKVEEEEKGTQGDGCGRSPTPLFSVLLFLLQSADKIIC